MSDFSEARRGVSEAQKRLETAYVAELGKHQAKLLDLNHDIADLRARLDVLSRAIKARLAGQLNDEALAFAEAEAMRE